MKKICDRVTVLLFCLFLAVCSVLFWVLPDREFSETENRVLEQLPTPHAESVLSGAFSSEMNAYFADQFPFRDGFVKLKALTELSLLKGENNGVLYADGQLAVRSFDAYGSRLVTAQDCDRYYEEAVRAQLLRINALADTLDVPLVTLLPPRSIDIAQSRFLYALPYGDALYALCENTLSERSQYLPLVGELQRRYNGGEYVIYRTDHHWTSFGAYCAYEQLATRLGFTPIPLSAWETTEIQGFSGTTAARASFRSVPTDTITLYSRGTNFTVTADGEDLDGLFALSYADASDRYRVFLGGTHGITEIRSGEERETLLVFKDSFADCLLPFLAEHYDIVALDLKTHPNVSEAVESYHASAVLIVWNLENLITTSYLGNLR